MIPIYYFHGKILGTGTFEWLNLFISFECWSKAKEDGSF